MHEYRGGTDCCYVALWADNTLLNLVPKWREKDVFGKALHKTLANELKVRTAVL
jgi:hypothetical protein